MTYIPPCTDQTPNSPNWRGPSNMQIFDATIDHTEGRNYDRAVTAARVICRTMCDIREQCLRDNHDAAGVIAGYTVDERARLYPNGRRRPGPTATHPRCTVPDCNAKHLAKGMCRRHYNAEKRKEAAA